MPWHATLAQHYLVMSKPRCRWFCAAWRRATHAEPEKRMGEGCATNDDHCAENQFAACSSWNCASNERIGGAHVQWPCTSAMLRPNSEYHTEREATIRPLSIGSPRQLMFKASRFAREKLGGKSPWQKTRFIACHLPFRLFVSDQPIFTFIDQTPQQSTKSMHVSFANREASR